LLPVIAHTLQTTLDALVSDEPTPMLAAPKKRDPQKKRFFSQLRGERRTADPAELLFSRQQDGAGRGRSGLYVPAGWLGGVSRWGWAVGGSGLPVLGGAGTGGRRERRAPLFGL